MKVIKVTKEYFQTEDEKVYFFVPLEKEISVEDIQEIVDTTEELVKKIKGGKNEEIQMETNKSMGCNKKRVFHAK